VIETVLKSVSAKRIEEAYQKKCGILCELNQVFGRIAKPKRCNILVTRLSTDQEEDTTNNMDKNSIALKKLIALNKIECLRQIDTLHRVITQRNIKLQVAI